MSVAAVRHISLEPFSVSKDMDTYVRKLPLGVCASITPFNFPAMIPLWTIPMAAVTGNTLILKPSERDPGASLIVRVFGLRHRRDADHVFRSPNSHSRQVLNT